MSKVVSIFKAIAGPKKPPAPPPIPARTQAQIDAEATRDTELASIKDKEEERKKGQLGGLYGRRSLMGGQQGSFAGYRRSLFDTTGGSGGTLG
jgi:hypothetical protein